MTTHNTTAARPLPAYPTVLTIAGSDCSGGAGIQADLATINANGAYAMSAVTAVTAQNTFRIQAVAYTSASMLQAQLDAIFEDIRPHAVKIGMVAKSELIEVIAERLTYYRAQHVVLDPVMISTSGTPLIDDEAITTLTTRLFPLASLVTPNIPETERLIHATHGSIDTQQSMQQAAHIFTQRYGCAVLIKAGHAANHADDLLATPQGAFTWFHSDRLTAAQAHGTGCTLSSAIATYLARGFTLTRACAQAKAYVTGALQAKLVLGAGSAVLDYQWQAHQHTPDLSQLSTQTA